MPFYKKKIFLVCAGIAIAGLAGALILLLNLQAFKPRLERAASSALRLDVRVGGRVGFSLFPGFGLSLRDVTVGNKGSVVVAAKKVKITADLLPLLRREFRISGIILTSPVFSIVRDKAGAFNFTSTEHTPQGGAFAIKKISVNKGKLAYLDEASARRVEAAGLDISLGDLSYGGADTARPFNAVSFTGSVSCGSLVLGGAAFNGLAANITGGKGVFEARSDSLALFGGTGKLSVRADLTGRVPHYTAAGALDQFNVAELVSAASPGRSSIKMLEGKADVAADLAAEGKTARDMKRSLKGSLSLSGKDLMLYGVDIDALIPKYERSQNFNLVDVGAFLLAGPFGPALTKSYNFGSLYEESRGGKGEIKKLVSVWKVKHGVAEAADVGLASKKHRLAMKGGLDFNTDQFSDVTIAVLNKRGCAVYTQKIQGSFNKPRIGRVSILKSLTGSVSNALEDAWGLLEGCRVFYSGSVAQPEK